MTNRIESHFAQARADGRKSLVMFLTAGFPSLDMTPGLVEALDRGGADILELGVPFSDPIADGPVIQAASTEAIRAGVTLARILDTVTEIRRVSQIPIVLFGAFNPFLHFGLGNLARRAVQAGVDGFLVPDLPIEESSEFEGICRAHGLSFIQLVAPTTPPDRMRTIVSRSSGFVYFISIKGVTGVEISIDDELRSKVSDLKTAAGPLPVAVGFGIQKPEHAAQVAALSDAVVVGSALIRLVGECRAAGDLMERVESYTRSLKRAID